MRLIFAIPQSLDDPSGRGRYWPLARELARLGHRVTLVCLHPDLAACHQRRFSRDGVHVLYVAQMHVRKRAGTKTYFPAWMLPWVAGRAALAMAVALRDVEADALHIAKAQPINGLATLARPGWWRNGRVYVDCDDHEAGSNNFQRGWQRSLVARVEDGLVRRARAVSVNTSVSAARVRSLGVPEARVVLVPNGVDRRRVQSLPSGLGAELRRRHGLQDGPLVVYVGSLSLANHAVDLLLDSFALAAQRRPQLRLVLVGGGEDAPALRERAQQLGIGKRALFVGAVGPEEALAWLQTADLSVDPARDDPAHRARAPLKLVEAMAVGTPTLTSDVGDRIATLGEGAAGYFVPPGDAQALAEGIVAALDDPADRQERSRAALAAAESYYWDRLVHRFVHLYELG
ncbi:MAG: glycosyltransferase family 4 protein [Anaerolineae bacterium]|nr:glycosyltransferase family 4 protein [Anaerolineae bacterium]